MAKKKAGSSKKKVLGKKAQKKTKGGILIGLRPPSPGMITSYSPKPSIAPSLNQLPPVPCP